MEDSRTRTLLLIVISFLVGLLIGWFLLGWVVAPVDYTGALIQDLDPAAKQAYLEMVAEAHQLDRDSGVAVERLQPLGSPAEVEVLANQVVQTATAEGDMATAQRVQALADAVGLQISPEAAAGTATAPDVAPAGQEDSPLRTVCLTGLGLLVVLGGIALAAWLLTRRRTAQQEEEIATEIDLEDEEPSEHEPVQRQPAPASAAPALAVQEYTATYNLGDSSYDESFDIEGPQGGSYLGECGMTLSEFVNGDPNRATALEVWLFDKSDIRTVTKVLMSDFAYENPTLREKLSARGETALARPGLAFVLDAETLRLEGRITALRYVEDDAPPNSTIEQMSVTLRVIQQAAG